jgi:hypothetical protein
MLIEHSGIWFIPTIGSDTLSILLKAPTNILKAIVKGCEVRISFAINEGPSGRMLLSCFQILDDRTSPLTVCEPHYRPTEQEALIQILET